MAIETDQFVHLSRPLAAAAHNIQTNIAPLTVIIQPQAIISVLDHAARRDINETSQSTRVIGALVGVRSEDGTEVEVRSCFAIPHTENEDQVEVDVDYQKTMLALTLRAAPREVLLGWYTTSPELNSFSALIQNFFASPDTGTFPHPAVHLTMSTTPGEAPQTRCYISAPVAVNPERAAESCLFMQVPHKLAFGGDAERNALEAIAASKDDESRLAPVEPEMEILARAIEQTMDLLGRVGEWVNNVLDEEEEPNDALGQYLMNALSLAPKVDPAQIEHDFNNHIQDVLMVSYLANTIRTQIDLAQRLASSTFGPIEKDSEGKAIEGGDKAGEERGQGAGGRGGRGGKRGGGGRGGNNRTGGQNRDNREPREPREPREE